jgi:hypothetical protein
MSHSLSNDSSDDCAGLEFPESHSSADQAQSLPRKKNGGVSRRSWRTKVLVVCFLMGSLFFVMSPVNQTSGLAPDQASSSTASSSMEITEGEPCPKPQPAIISLIFAVGLITFLHRR